MDGALSRGPPSSSSDPQLSSANSPQVMDAPLRRPAGVLGSPPAPGSQPADSEMLTPGSASSNTTNNNSSSSNNKPLAFSIDRIMARTPEPRSIPLPGWLPSSPTGKADVCPSSLHCMIPLVPLGYEAGHRLGIAGLDPGHLDGSSLGAPADVLGFGLAYKSQQQQQQQEEPLCHGVGQGAGGHYKLFRPRVLNQSAFPAVGTVCYLNCGGGDASYPPPAGLLNLHPMASYLLGARHKALLAEKRAPGGQQNGERFPGAPGHIHSLMKERDALADKILLKGSAAAAAAAARLGGSCPGSKPKVFTCEVCGKVRSGTEATNRVISINVPCSFSLQMGKTINYFLFRQRG